jgi:hypothetical protein
MVFVDKYTPATESDDDYVFIFVLSYEVHVYDTINFVCTFADAFCSSFSPRHVRCLT